MIQIGCSVLCLIHSLLDPERVAVFSVSSGPYLILGWNNSFLFCSAFYHYDNIPEKINLKGGKIYIVCWLWSFQCIITWPHCLWTCTRPKSMSWQELIAEEAAYSIDRKQKRDKNWVRICSRAHLPWPLKGSTISLLHHGMSSSLSRLVFRVFHILIKAELIPGQCLCFHMFI
jgi:hypothetical protein